jgi:hypothetical protein
MPWPMPRFGKAIEVKAALAVLAGLLPAAVAQPEGEPKKLVEESRRVATEFVTMLRGELSQEMEHSGPVRSILVCKFRAPEIASALSRKTGWRVTRVSLRPRNPALGVADPWEQRVLAEFDQRAQRGENPEAIEFGEVVQEPAGKVFRYMKALPTTGLCLSCHGPAESLTEAVKAQLAREYPHDRAIGYTLGQVRGAVSVKRNL